MQIADRGSWESSGVVSNVQRNLEIYLAPPARSFWASRPCQPHSTSPPCRFAALSACPYGSFRSHSTVVQRVRIDTLAHVCRQQAQLCDRCKQLRTCPTKSALRALCHRNIRATSDKKQCADSSTCANTSFTFRRKIIPSSRYWSHLRFSESFATAACVN